MIRFCLALASVAFWPALPGLHWLLVVVLLCLCGAIFQLGKLRLTRLQLTPPQLTRSLSRMLLPVFLGLAYGLASSYWLLAHRLPDSWQAVDLVAQGTVVGLPQRQHDRCRFDLALDQLTNPAVIAAVDPAQETLSVSTLTRMPRRLRLSWYGCRYDLQPGQRWQLQVRLKRPHGFVNPGGFDYSLYLLTRGIDATGYVRSTGADNTQVDTAATQFDNHNQRLDHAVVTGRLDRRRSELIATVHKQLGSSDGSAAAGLLAALLVGDKRGLDEAMWQTLRDTGTAHLVVVSGMHIGMVAGFCYGLVFWLGRLRPQIRYRYRQIAAACSAIVGSGGYAALAGFDLPTQRAWVMVCALMLSLIGWRSMRASQRLWLAAAAVMIVEPLAIRQAGFWLSFGACAVLVYAFAGRIGRISPVRQLLWAQLAIVAGLTPWLLLLFSQWPPLAPVINAVAIPLVTLLLPLLLLSALLLMLSPVLGGWLFGGIEPLLQWGWQGLEWAAVQVTPLEISAPISSGALLLALVGAAWLLLPHAVPGRWMGALLWLPLILPVSTQPELGGVRVTVLDVGQGLSVLVEPRHHRLLYDSGPRYRSGFNTAKAAIVPFLHSQGIRTLDRLIISHADSDHSGGQAVIEAQLQVGATLTGSAQVSADRFCQAGQQWRWDEVEFMVLYPTEKVLDSPSVSENNRSCVLMIATGKQRVLLTGDIQAPVERLLVELYADQLSAQTLLAAHHGSRTSTTERFLGQINPDRVLISSGWRNRFGHPHRDVIDRINRARADGSVRDLFNTATDGAIRLQVDAAGEVSISTAVASQWAFWRGPLLDR